jgi:hypothetical protein
MDEYIKAEMVINRQGLPLVNEAYVAYEGDQFALIEVDMRSKWCDVCYSSGASLGIGTTDRSCHLNEDRPIDETWDDESTEIHFPKYADGTWTLWSCELSRYTLRICFEKVD